MLSYKIYKCVCCLQIPIASAKTKLKHIETSEIIGVSWYHPSGAKTLGPGKEFLLSGREVRTHGLRREKADVVHQTKRGL